ncbi:DUF4302 domain-containing protein [Pseudochryseolinea flava]|uniref:DUF4302 domain-containing protein n=1 Tax=Pseudochryseolinea flava TaxID=2059302 RepID=A0A364Y3M8_9BACT|nr:DUF4302 domain-containing protein [Pseudochryseolinea flava]RAW01386.1 hypothetical protein DQQ10_10820 [Pseudochryseolinea flava]
MKKLFYLCLALLLVITSCQDDDINKFDKSADERVAEAISGLKSKLTAPDNGWVLKYRPENASGSFHVLLKFNDDNTVNIKTDVGYREGKFHDQTITYRIDNALGLELIFESYSFFSFLFEQNGASFGAEFEFIYQGETSSDALAFRSKSDRANPTVLFFEEATANAEDLLGPALWENLNEFSTASRLVYEDKDLAVYLSFDTFRRTAHFNYISAKTTLSQGKVLDLTTGYILRGDSIVFDKPLETSFKTNTIKLKSILMEDFEESTLERCGTPEPSPIYSGATNANQAVTLERTLFNGAGASFQTNGEIFFGDIRNIFDENGDAVDATIAADLQGAIAMLIYNTNDLTAVGFFLENADGSNTIAVLEGTPTFTGNILSYDFASELTVFRNTNPDANLDNIQPYIDRLTQGGQTYIYPYNDTFYELYNPCSGWRFYFEIVQ